MAKATGKVGDRLNEFALITSEVVVKFLVATLVCLAVGACFPSAQAAARDPAAVQSILVFGDSLSDGFGLSRAEAYPALLARKARAAGYKVEVVNAGVSGGTTAGGLQRLPQYLTRQIDVLVLELGINDAFRGVPLIQIRANLQSIIDRTRQRNPKVHIVIAGMQLPLPGSGSYLEGFGNIYRELAEKNRAALIPYLLQGVGGDPTLNLPDLIHPNAAGQRILAENVWRALEPFLRKTADTATARR
ncbi:MAG: arylesterase [Chthoniobacterales bacterium]